MVEQCERDGVELTSMNPVVGECNDASLNKITERVIGIPEVRAAIDGACRDFEEGDVGAGKGTTCFGMKGGIGSASRPWELDGKNVCGRRAGPVQFWKDEAFCPGWKAPGRIDQWEDRGGQKG